MTVDDVDRHLAVRHDTVQAAPPGPSGPSCVGSISRASEPHVHAGEQGARSDEHGGAPDAACLPAVLASRGILVFTLRALHAAGHGSFTPPSVPEDRFRRPVASWRVPMAPAPSYEQWNVALADWYFPDEGAGRAAYLAVDDDDLRAVAADREFSCADAAEALSEAVRSRLGPSNDCFAPFRRMVSSWRKQADVPPYIGLLALFVLAASRMETDPASGVHGNDYYSRLNPLVNRRQSAGMPAGFDGLARLWIDLRQWLDDDLAGARGRSAIPTPPFFVNIGYPLSQSALRASDRHRLPDFFQNAGLEPQSEIADSRLLALLRAWAARPSCGLSNHGRKAVLESEDGPRAAAIVAIAQRELEDWDGSLRDVEGRRRAECVLVLAMRRGQILSARVFAPRPDDFPIEAKWMDTRGGVTTLHQVAPGWYSEISCGDLKGLLREGLLLTHERYALSFSRAALVVFSKTFVPESGWLSQRKASLLHDHILLARAALRPAIEDFLNRHAATGWKPLGPTPALAGEWVGYSDVVLRSVPVTPVLEGLEPLVPRMNTATQTEGGLRLGTALYLTGGEPDLYVTVDAGELAEVEIDGKAETFREGTVKLALRNSGLGAGPHVIRAGGRTITFTGERTLGQIEPDSAGQLAQVIEKHRRYQPRSLYASDGAESPAAPGTVRICGASVDGSADDLPMPGLPPVVLARGFVRYEVLGAVPGQIEVLESPPKPAWLEHLNAGAQYFEANIGFEPQIVILTGRGGKTVRALRIPPHPPDERNQTGPSPSPPPSSHRGGSPIRSPGGSEHRTWASAVLDAAESAPLVPDESAAVWEAYVSTAHTIRHTGRP